MKLLKLGLRALITLGSVFSFMLGWVLLGHSPKPVQTSNSTITLEPMPSGATLPTLAPLPALDQTGSGGTQPQPFQGVIVQQQPAFQQFNPRFVTAGS